MWPFNKKQLIVKVYRSDSPKRLAKDFEKDARGLAKDGYSPVFVNDQNVGLFGITTEQVRTVTYQLRKDL